MPLRLSTSARRRDGGLTHVLDKGLGPRGVGGRPRDRRRLHRHRQARLGHRLRDPRTWSGSSRCCRTSPSSSAGRSSRSSTSSDKLDEYKRWLDELGLTHVEISDGTVDIPRERKLELIADFARDFTVLSEVGSKDSEVVFAPYQWVQWLREELDAGAWKVITEAREGGTAGIFRPSGDMRTGLIDEIAHEIDFHDLVWEAPTKATRPGSSSTSGPRSTSATSRPTRSSRSRRSGSACAATR